jgi:hypothetical protein
MIKQTITYKDFDDVERTEDFYFNLTQAEVMEMELTTKGGLANTIQKIIDAKNTPELIRLFKDLILKAYGEKSADGRQFAKSAEITKAFTQTEAYSQLFMKLALENEPAAAFVNGIMPNMDDVKARNNLETSVIGDDNEKLNN